MEIVKNPTEDGSLAKISNDEELDLLDKDERIMEEISDETVIQSMLNLHTVQEVENDKREVATTSDNITWHVATDTINTFVTFDESNE